MPALALHRMRPSTGGRSAWSCPGRSRAWIVGPGRHRRLSGSQSRSCRVPCLARRNPLPAGHLEEDIHGRLVWEAPVNPLSSTVTWFQDRFTPAGRRNGKPQREARKRDAALLHQRALRTRGDSQARGAESSHYVIRSEGERRSRSLQRGHCPARVARDQAPQPVPVAHSDATYKDLLGDHDRINVAVAPSHDHRCREPLDHVRARLCDKAGRGHLELYWAGSAPDRHVGAGGDEARFGCPVVASRRRDSTSICNDGADLGHLLRAGRRVHDRARCGLRCH